MTCESELQAAQAQLDSLRVQNGVQRSKIAEIRTEINSLSALIAAGGGLTTPAAVASLVAAPPPRRPTTQAEPERRAAGSGEEAQVAALLRDIEDMEQRLDKLEAR